MIDFIEHRGKLLHECPLAGERRAEGVFPAHATGLQLSADRFLLLYTTRGYRGTDDDRSVVAEIRAHDYTGPVRHRVMLRRSIDDWDPFNDGSRFVRQHGHAVAFGVPKGARIAGQDVPHANVFAIKWRVVAVEIDPDTGLLRKTPELRQRTQGVEWMQVRLDEGGDDLEILQPPQPMRQQGYEHGKRFCAAPVEWMNQTFVPAVPYNNDASEWVDVNHFDGRIAPLRYRFDASAGRYVWAQTGELIGAPETTRLSEASLAWHGGRWVIAARHSDRIAWAQTDDLFGPPQPMTLTDQPHNNSPLAVFRCPDGALRLLSGDPGVSPYSNGRDPLYMWEVDPDRGFAVSDRRVVFDSVQAHIGISREQMPRIDMAKLLPHIGGHVQYLVHRVRSKATLDPAKTGRPISRTEQDVAGVYHATVHYREKCHPTWSFATKMQETNPS